MTFIFDLDGTLIDSYDIMVKQLHTLLSPYEEHDAFSIRKEILETSITAFIQKQVVKHGLDGDKVIKDYLQMQTKTKPTDYPLLPEVKETLTQLAIDHQLFIYTHRDSTTHAILEAHELTGLFEAIITSENAFERKPSPQALNHLIDKYALDPSKTYYIGDRALDIACGINAGVKTIYFGELTKENNDATHCIQSFSEILDPSIIMLAQD